MEIILIFGLALGEYWQASQPTTFREQAAETIRATPLADLQKGHLLLLLVRKGMSEKQVHAVFGSSACNVRGSNGYLTINTYTDYWTYGAIIDFTDGQVVGKRFSVCE